MRTARPRQSVHRPTCDRRSPDRRPRAGGFAPLGAPGLEPLELRRLLAAAGLPDPTFGGGDGSVLTPFDGSRVDVAAASVTQADGKVVVVGGTSDYTGLDDFALARFNPDGTVDKTFGAYGRVVTDFGGDDVATAVAVQADGKLVVAGTSAAGPGTAVRVARYNPDGSLDKTFGVAGVARVAPGTYNGVSSVRVLTGGKIVLGGYATGAGFDVADFMLARLTPVGALDPTFGTAGVTLTDVDGNLDVVGALVVADNGRVIAAGHANLGALSSFHTSVVLARYDAAGKLDPTYGTGGKVVVDAGGYERVADALRLADGSIVLADNYFGTAVVRKFTAAGAPDTAFGVGGRAPLGVADTENVRTIVPVAGNKFLVAAALGGSGGYDNGDLAVVRLTPNGSVDPTYGLGGVAALKRPGVQVPAGMSLQSTGAAAVVSSTGETYEPEWNPNFDLVRFAPAGAPDATFNKNYGIASADFLSATSAYATDVAPAPDGKIVAVGVAESNTPVSLPEIAIARYRADGQLDPTFGDGGRVVYGQGEPTRVFVRADGKVVVAALDTSNNSVMRLFQFNADGSLDTAFGSRGIADTGVYAERGGANIVRTADGKILVAGGATASVPSALRVVRLTAAGQFDPTFGAGGATTLTNLGAFRATSLAIAPDGKLLVGGGDIANQTPPIIVRAAVVRLTAAGALDTSFGTAGKTVVNYGTLGGGEVVALVVRADGSVVAGAGENGAATRLFRLTPAGNADPAFGLVNGNTPLPPGVKRLLIEPSGTILAGGGGGYLAGTTLIAARFTAGGFPVADFGDSGVARVTVPAPAVPGGIALDAADRILIAGGGGSQFAVARVTAQERIAFGGIPAAIPGTIELEKFDFGHDGIAYRDLSAGNAGGAFRDTNVDLEAVAGTAGNYFVRSTQAGEWLEYTVSVDATGTFDLDARVASLGAGGTFTIAVDGRDVTGAIAVPDTGGWQTWKTVTKHGVPLTAGPHVLRVTMLTVGRSGVTGNFDSVRLSRPTVRDGLTAAYYDTPDFTGPARLATVSTVNFDWGLSSPFATIAPDTFSARFDGFLTAPTTGDYTLYARSDDGARVWANGKLVVDDWNRHPATTERSAVVRLTAGRKVALRLDYFEAFGSASVRLSWSGPGVAKQVIPTTALSTA
ncbi:MAG: PA14 domain-containing protein [Phycisphaerae bacterium]